MNTTLVRSWLIMLEDVVYPSFVGASQLNGCASSLSKFSFTEWSLPRVGQLPKVSEQMTTTERFSNSRDNCQVSQ